MNKLKTGMHFIFEGGNLFENNIALMTGDGYIVYGWFERKVHKKYHVAYYDFSWDLVNKTEIISEENFPDQEHIDYPYYNKDDLKEFAKIIKEQTTNGFFPGPHNLKIEEALIGALKYCENL